MSNNYNEVREQESGDDLKESDFHKSKTWIGTARNSSRDDDMEAMGDDGNTSKEDAEKAPDSNQEPRADPNIVDWDGPDDPANPLNWSKPIRLRQVALISLITLIAYVFSLLLEDSLTYLKQKSRLHDICPWRRPDDGRLPLDKCNGCYIVRHHLSSWVCSRSIIHRSII